LLRFESTEHSRTTSLAEVAEFALGDAPAAVMVMMAETSGLIGANLQQAPDTFVENPFAFPEIRNRLGFTSERAFRDGTSLIVGFVARPGTELDAWLRPIGNELLGHLHAAAFPYRPLQKGKVDLNTTVSAFFESQTLQSVLHLINDTRAPGGAGDSEFYRGACWVSPLSL
jgi:hypothetical protein